MPAALHEALVTLVRNRPALVPALALERATALRVPADESRIVVAAAEFAELQPAEYRADVVLRIDDENRQAQDVLIVEVQIDIDHDKLFSWPLYVAGARARFRCPATIVVITLSNRVARWCQEPIILDRMRGSITPVVIDPRVIPAITDLQQARLAPELAVLSAMAHGRRPGGEGIALAALAGCDSLDNHHADLYADLVLANLGQTAKIALEALMAEHGYSYQSDFARKYFAQGIEQGIEQGMRQALHTLFEQRFGDMPANLASKLEQGDAQSLSRWLGQMLTASSPADVFAD